MAKSLRSKTKRHFRAIKRVKGDYAVTEAARLDRLNAKLYAITTSEKEPEANGGDNEDDEIPDKLDDGNAVIAPTPGSMEVDEGVETSSLATKNKGLYMSSRQRWKLKRGKKPTDRKQTRKQ